MKKFIALSLVIILVLATFVMFGCSTKQSNGTKESTKEESISTEDVSAGLANPIEDVKSLDEVNKGAGVNMKETGIKDCTYQIINGTFKIGQILFNYNNAEYTYRGAKSEGDISGVYILVDGESKPLGDVSIKDQTPIEVGEGELYARWFGEDKAQYSLYAKGATAEDFQKIYETVK